MATNLEILHLHRAASFYETMQERFEEGYEEGVEDGFEKGIDTEKLGTIKRMLKANMSDDMIAIATEFTLEQVANYRNQFQLEKGPEHGN
ncbi:hypothetical protein [Streptococcus suis]|uniref:hypothetical protein n=1 Tax=Streptococcus suis TaxID=1307 RepID=UPI0012902124|nr:hypothetical protein [Streptococcus suis]